MHPQCVAGLQVVDDNLAVQGNPCLPLTGVLLQPTSGAGEDARSEALLEPDRELHAELGAEETVAMHHVSLAGRDLQRQDLPRQLGGEGEKTGSAPAVYSVMKSVPPATAL